MESDSGQVQAAPRQPAQAPTPSSNGGGGRGRGGGGGGFRRSWRRRWPDGRPPRPRVRKLRLLLIVVGLAALALVSTVFGMMMAVASDLPQLENTQQYAQGRTSYLYDDQGHPIGPLEPPGIVNNDQLQTHLGQVIDDWHQISPAMIHAIVAVEDKRFWTDPGVDLHGVVRAIWSDLTGGATQGASTIAEQFVKNTLHEENNRTIFEKLREAALAFQLSHKWSRVKILTEYLNSIYFGNGAYGVESAARVYFGKALGYDPNAPSDGQISRCGDSTRNRTLPTCASQLQPWQAAMLAGLVANPSAFNPTTEPNSARARRDLVLQDMLAQNYITRPEYEVSRAQALPVQADLQQPQEPAAAPYFTSWLRPQILRAMGYGKRGVSANVAEYRAYYGGLKIRTTLDLKMERAADAAISQDLPYSKGGVVASLVAIDNGTGQVRAMVGGPVLAGHEDYQQFPFNLATQAERQPGSAFKPFTLAAALESGYGPSSVFLSAPAQFVVPNSNGKEFFNVRNFGNTYSGPITLQEATTISDNSVFSRLGIIGLKDHGGTKRIATLAQSMGIRTPVSHNYAMILGGLKIGVSPLDMAHAYETLATNGKKVFDPMLGDCTDGRDCGPTGIARITCGSACPPQYRNLVDHPQYKRIIPASIGVEERDMLEGPVAAGTATAAAIPGVVVAGKTGTTTNYGDAWFVGWTPELTVAVWVGYPNSTTSMSTLFNGGPVEGGTYPAIIWHDFMVQALQILADEQHPNQSSSTSSQVSSGSSSSSSSSSPSSSSSSSGNGGGGGTGSGSGNGGGGTGQSAGSGHATNTPSGGGGNPTAGGGTPTPGGGGGTGSGSPSSGTGSPSSGTGSGSSGSGSGNGSGSGGSGGSGSGGSGLGGG